MGKPWAGIIYALLGFSFLFRQFVKYIPMPIAALLTFSYEMFDLKSLNRF